MVAKLLDNVLLLLLCALCALPRHAASSQCARNWLQCGGVGFERDQTRECCSAGSSCVAYSAYWAMCVPGVESVGGGDGDDCPNVAYRQCGGKLFRGSECCAANLRCERVSDWWSMCVPNNGGLGDDSPSPPSSPSPLSAPSPPSAPSAPSAPSPSGPSDVAEETPGSLSTAAQVGIGLGTAGGAAALAAGVVAARRRKQATEAAVASPADV